MNPPSLPPLSPTVELLVTVGSVLWLVLVAVWGVRRLDRREFTVLVVLMAAFLVAVFGEPVLDLLANCQWARNSGSVVVYSSHGRDILLWYVIIAPPWGATMAYSVYAATQRRWSVRRMWGLYAGLVAVHFVLDALLQFLGLYDYFGAQPFEVLGVPFNWPFVYSAGFVASGMLLYRAAPYFTGRRLFLLVPFAGTVFTAFGDFAGWPVTLGHGVADAPSWLMAVLALASVGIALLALHLGFLINDRTPRAGRSDPGSQLPGGRTEQVPENAPHA
ncbi:hypothetical protein ACQKM2_03630 [Streptomyces sp. NPDC004126]|uniref:hypothetical protein n=1 Tax=Streptomyces sp. NPDC004126 TaxID=3390695 RepID=UPI003D04425F